MKMPTRDWQDPLVRKLIAKHRGRDPHEIIEARARELLAEAGQDKLPIDVEGVASLLGIRRRLGEYSFAGRIYAEPSGQLVMDLTKSDRPARRRFTCGHEIIHTVFPGFSREARYRVDATVGNHTRERNEEEFLCDLGAAELLLPSNLLLAEYDISAGLQEVERLAEDAEASLEAAANRLVELSDEGVALIVLEVSHKPADRSELRKGQSVPKRLRVRYAKSRALSTYVPRFKSVDEDSPYGEALATGDLVRGVDTLPGSNSTKFSIEAKRYDRGSSDGTVERVLALVKPRQSQ